MGAFTFDIAEGKTRDELAELYREKCRAIGRLTDRIEELEALLTEAATELEDTAKGLLSPGKYYPSEAARYERDMDLPRRIRAALEQTENGKGE